MSQVEIAFQVDKKFKRNLKARLGIRTDTELVRAAFSLLNWTADEARTGRCVLSAESDGRQIRRLVVPGVPELDGLNYPEGQPNTIVKRARIGRLLEHMKHATGAQQDELARQVTQAVDDLETSTRRPT